MGRFDSHHGALHTSVSAGKEAIETVEPSTQWMASGMGAQMPLSNVEGCIARASKKLSNGLLVIW